MIEKQEEKGLSIFVIDNNDFNYLEDTVPMSPEDKDWWILWEQRKKKSDILKKEKQIRKIPFRQLRYIGTTNLNHIETEMLINKIKDSPVVDEELYKVVESDGPIVTRLFNIKATKDLEKQNATNIAPIVNKIEYDSIITRTDLTIEQIEQIEKLLKLAINNKSLLDEIKEINEINQQNTDFFINLLIKDNVKEEAE